MQNIPYPEFNYFKLELVKRTIVGEEPVKGFALLSVNNGKNCIKGSDFCHF
jgi:hypothetical protein